MEGVTWKCWLSRAHKIRNQLCSAVACPRPRPEVASAFHPSRARGALKVPLHTRPLLA